MGAGRDEIGAKLCGAIFGESENGGVKTAGRIAVSDGQHVNLLPQEKSDRGAAVVRRGHGGSLCDVAHLAACLGGFRADEDVFNRCNGKGGAGLSRIEVDLIVLDEQESICIVLNAFEADYVTGDDGFGGGRFLRDCSGGAERDGQGEDESEASFQHVVTALMPWTSRKMCKSCPIGTNFMAELQGRARSDEADG
jgi:hypothetical protein